MLRLWTERDATEGGLEMMAGQHVQRSMTNLGTFADPGRPRAICLDLEESHKDAVSLRRDQTFMTVGLDSIIGTALQQQPQHT